MKKHILRIAFFLISINQISAQLNTDSIRQSQIGQSLSEFRFNNVVNYPEKHFTIKEQLGKYLILDFWSLGCTGCVHEMPRLNKLQEQFANKIQIVLICPESEAALKFYKKLLAKYHWTLPSVFDDSLFKRFNVTGVPLEVWIDSNGSIKSFTQSDDLTSENISSFIKNGKPPKVEKEIDSSKRLRNCARSTLGDTVFIYHSSLTTFNINGGGTFFSWDSSRFMYCTSVLTMYITAYSHLLSPSRVIYETTDSNKIKNVMKSVFCYELQIPVTRKNDAGKLIKDDLERFFGYRAKIDIREVNTWCLIKEGNINLKATSDSSISESSLAGIHLKNQQFSELVDRLNYYLSENIPFTSEVDFPGKIDIDINANMLDVEDINLSLEKYGLKIVNKKCRIPMLVIYEPDETP